MNHAHAEKIGSQKAFLFSEINALIPYSNVLILSKAIIIAKDVIYV